MADPNNPYAPPQSPDFGAPPPLPPESGVHTSVPKVFGVLSIIFASFIGLCGLGGSCSFAGVGLASSVGDLPGSKLEEMRPMMDAMKTVYMGFGFQGLILLAMSIWLLVLGIGQLRYRQWACRQSVTWGLVALVALGVMVAISLLVVGPAYKQMFEAIAHSGSRSGEVPKMPAGVGVMLGGTMAAMMVVFYAPYPVLMIAMFSRENVRGAMRT
jgi:hypothetical protein